jgi:maltose O-acetyltransferase
MTEKQKMISGMLYNASDETLVKLRAKARLIFEEFNKTSVTQEAERRKLIKDLFGKVGKNFYIEPSFRCDYGFNIHVGENFYMNFNCVFLDVCEIDIGDNCLIAPNVSFYTATHPVDPAERLKGLEFGKAITIGSNCWIGGSAVINPGVTLGNNVTVASGSVVTTSFGDNVVIAGNPARVIRTL